MKKFQVWVDLTDRRYAKRLIDFLTIRYGDQMQVMEAGENRGPEDGILLTDKKQSNVFCDQTIWVSAGQGLNPYQSGHQIAKEILAKREGWGVKEEPAVFSGKMGEWVSVYSPVGGIGKTTLAMGLADILAKKKKVLFISMEGPSSWTLYYQYPLSYTLSDFFYSYLVEAAEERGRSLQEMTSRQSNGVFFLPPCLYPDDLMELTKEEIEDWMRLLRQNFDYVVADLGSQLFYPMRIILDNSSKPCFLLDQRADGRAKWHDFQALKPSQQEQWFFSRYADKSKQEEICLPEEAKLFDLQDGKRRMNPRSSYYGCLERAIESWL